MTAAASSHEDESRKLQPLVFESNATETNSSTGIDSARPSTPPPLLSPGLSSAVNSAERIFPIRSVKHYRQSTPSSPSLLRANSGEPPLSTTTTPDAHAASAAPAASESLGSRISKEDPEPLMTSRFEHTVLENGDNWIITGNQGKLERCEDEPIRSPGAVQSFGVLLVFDQAANGDLYVQQVSENSTVILGISPAAFFRSKSLLEFLSEEEGEALVEALESLDERDADESNEEFGPYTFQLSGTGTARTPLEWTAYCAIHRPDRTTLPERVILELERVEDPRKSTCATPEPPRAPDEKGGMESCGIVEPSVEDLMLSTVSLVKPLRELSRSRGSRVGSKQKELNVVQLLSQVNEQFSKTENLEEFYRIVAGVFKELTEFDRTMIYQFDDSWNGRVVAEQVDWSKTKDLYRGLNFPATDIPAQARELYRINKVRCLYDRDSPTARMCCRSRAEVETPLNMTHSHLRAISPIHCTYLQNMGVRSSMSISITAFGNLYGLIACHHYGDYGHRVSFPVRQLCKLLGDSVSKNIERLSYAKRLHSRKLINTAPTNSEPSGYIVAKAEDLLQLFDADIGILSIGDEAKILGTMDNSQELLAVLEYLRAKCFTSIQASQDIKLDYPDIDYPAGFDLICGLLAVPLSSEGKDFIVFFRKGQREEIHWAGNPNKPTVDGKIHNALEPRKSFATWSETIVGKARTWTEEQKETAGVLCLVYGKFIDVWRQKETALAANQLTNLLLANASHEARTPLNAIINYLEMALDNGALDDDVRENLTRSHAASRSLIHVINDLLDLTRTETGNTLFLQDPFQLSTAIHDAITPLREECERRGLSLEITENPQGTPQTVLGDRSKVKQIISNVLANAVKHTESGGIAIEWGELMDGDIEDALDNKKDSIRIGISITDTGSGMSSAQLETIFREFEQVSTVEQDGPRVAGVGLGLAVCARIVQNLGGQLRVESKENVGSKFTFVIPFMLPSLLPPPPETKSKLLIGQSLVNGTNGEAGLGLQLRGPMRPRRTSAGSNESKKSVKSSVKSEIESLITAMAASHMKPQSSNGRSLASEVVIVNTEDETPSPPLKNDLLAPFNDRAAPRRDSSSSSRSSSFGATASPPVFTRNGIRRNVAGFGESPGSRSPSTSPTPPDGPHNADHYDVAIEFESEANTPKMDPPSPPKSPALANYRDFKPMIITPQDPNQVRPLRVLVVEDEPINRMIIQKRLQKDGHEVTLAEHGGQAIRAFESDVVFDIILMDLQMPIVNGYEAAAHIRGLEAKFRPSDARTLSARLNGGFTPIFAVSASLHERQRQTIAAVGIDGWLLKPVDFKRLRVLLRGSYDVEQRAKDVYEPGAWEKGGWLNAAPQ